MSEARVRLNDPFVGSRPIPLPHVQVNATTSGGADTFATVRTGVILKIKQLAAVNTTGAAALIYLNSIPSGGTIGDDNAEIKAASIPANTAADLTSYIGQVYAPGTVLKVYSDTADAITIHGWAEEVL